MRLATVTACALAILLAAGAGAATTQFAELSPGSIGLLSRILAGCEVQAVVESFDVVDDIDIAMLFDEALR
jgi:hypothetical protein